MKLIKVVIAVALVGGALTFYGIRPADLLEQGSEVWEGFSGDFMAIFNGEAKDKLAKEIKGSSENAMRAVYVPASEEVGDESNAIAQEIMRERQEVANSATRVIDLDPEEYKKRLQELKQLQQ